MNDLFRDPVRLTLIAHTRGRTASAMTTYYAVISTANCH